MDNQDLRRLKSGKRKPERPNTAVMRGESRKWYGAAGFSEMSVCGAGEVAVLRESLEPPSILDDRAKQRRSSHIRQEQNIAREMERQVSQGRSQSIGYER